MHGMDRYSEDQHVGVMGEIKSTLLTLSCEPKVVADKLSISNIGARQVAVEKG